MLGSCPRRIINNSSEAFVFQRLSQDIEMRLAAK